MGGMGQPTMSNKKTVEEKPGFRTAWKHRWELLSHQIDHRPVSFGGAVGMAWACFSAGFGTAVFAPLRLESLYAIPYWLIAYGMYRMASKSQRLLAQKVGA